MSPSPPPVFPDGGDARAHAGTVAAFAVRAALHEAAATRKPGLVCADARGAHRDMDIATMVASAVSLGPYFHAAALLGWETRDEEPDAVFPRLRSLGIRAEKRMFAATGGVNTHKGLIFSLGLFCAAAGKAGGLGLPLRAEALSRLASGYARGIVAADFAVLRESPPECSSECPAEEREAAVAARLGRKLTAGEILYLRHGASGIRGEAEAGFPHVVRALEVFRRHHARETFNDALVATLLFLVAEVEDTNLLWRGGTEGAAFARSAAAGALALGGTATPEGLKAVAAMGEAFVKRRLSPGGCADLTALVLFLRFAETPPPSG
ncbi:MAG: triphosphoribosyl-dephospho-CoA synthase [Deltaproteobacteria bacterium]|nr:triphosphoribosyl-dephospho-CoA synthase [Deltaproteobacteria bacterium]